MLIQFKSFGHILEAKKYDNIIEIEFLNSKYDCYLGVLSFLNHENLIEFKLFKSFVETVARTPQNKVERLFLDLFKNISIHILSIDTITPNDCAGTYFTVSFHIGSIENEIEMENYSMA